MRATVPVLALGTEALALWLFVFVEVRADHGLGDQRRAQRHPLE